MIFETNLPGTSIQVIDEYNQSVYDSSQFGTTESVLIIGTAFDGPVGKEVAIYNPEHANYIFGGSYDSVAKRSATLTAYVQDAYNKGCRTIYCMRVGGKELSKTYRLKNASSVYLKVSSAFPSNKYKDMSLFISNGKLVILKSAAKATIEEKREGAVENAESIIKVEVDLNSIYGFTAESGLSELIEYLNNLVKNNVFKFALVDEKGVDITFDDSVRDIRISALFDGLYTVGRVNKAAATPEALVVNVDQNFHFSINSNADINAPYPYIDKDANYTKFETFGALASISDPDAIDYEEVKMSNFELYQKLGSGFAQTAMLFDTNTIKGEAPSYIVKPTPNTDPRFSVELAEGIYTTASNLKTDYRILANGYADDAINGRRPKIADFSAVSLTKIPVLKANKVDDAAGTLAQEALHAVYKLEDSVQQNYAFVVEALEDVEAALLPTLKKVQEGLENHALLTLETLGTATIQSGKYALVEAEGAYWIASDSGVIMSLEDLFKDEKDFITTIEKSSDDTGIVFTIKIIDHYHAHTSVDTFAEEFAISAIGKRFNFICGAGFENQLPVLDDVTDVILTANRSVGADPMLVIPYTTSDNFARQLAQHCEYTSLKTYQTHGIIGVKPINDTSIKSVTQKCATLLAKDYDLYVKSPIGRPVLGVDNLPYHIGKAITISAIQHTITTMDGYRFTASGQGAYVGRASTLPASTSSTNQALNITPHFTYSETQKTALSKAGYITVTFKDGVYKVVDGVTQAPSYSQFARFATFRTMKLVDRIIREATEPYIGKNNNMANRNSMYTSIKSGMDALLNEHLEKYEFTMDYSKQEARLGNINISYSIDIIDEIRNVKNTVTAKN